MLCPPAMSRSPRTGFHLWEMAQQVSDPVPGVKDINALQWTASTHLTFHSLLQWSCMSTWKPTALPQSMYFKSQVENLVCHAVTILINQGFTLFRGGERKLKKHWHNPRRTFEIYSPWLLHYYTLSSVRCFNTLPFYREGMRSCFSGTNSSVRTMERS